MRLQAAVAPASSVPSKAALLALFGLAAAGIAEGFAPRLLPRVGGVAGRSVLPPLPMAKQGGGGGGGKRRRRRKKKAGAPGGTDGGADNPPVAKIDIGVPQTDTAFPAVAESIPAAPILDVKAELEAAKMLGADIDRLSGDIEDKPLPDIRTAQKRRREKRDQEEEQARLEAEAMLAPKVDRSDAKAMRDLMEAQPFADADDSLFDREYNTVSALLGEGSKTFLGIGAGPLQIGHFIGALAIVLMAFVEYPGFPLTNLPGPLRDALAGGLGTVYACNVVMAVFAAFKAPPRGQSSLLWGIKTVAVGGLAYDQLTQLPTEEETAARKAVKGKRALGKNNR